MIFSISAKIEHGIQNSEKSQIFRGPTAVVFSAQGKQSLLTVFKIMTFSISTKFQDGGPNSENSKFSEVPEQ